MSDETSSFVCRNCGEEGHASCNRPIEAIRVTVIRLQEDLAATRRSLEEAATWFEERAQQVGQLKGYDALAVPGALGIRSALNGYAEKLRAFLAPPAATPPPCASWCGKRHDTHEHDYGEVFQDMPARVQMTRCYCTAACRDAGAPRNPVKP